jgi:hypothetical protein
MGPDEQGSLTEINLPGEAVQRVMRFSAGGIEDD